MNLKVVADNGEGLRLDGMALRVVIEALEFQLENWRKKTSADLDEDEFADMQNDIQYLEILLDRIRTEYLRINPMQAT